LRSAARIGQHGNVVGVTLPAAWIGAELGVLVATSKD
jgi:hypothetical protein